MGEDLLKGPVILFVTASSNDEAAAIAKPLVEEKLAACVNIVPGLRSIYHWQGELCDEVEVLLIIKSQAEHVSAIIHRVKELHSYDVPEVIALQIRDGARDYLDWLKTSTS